MYYKYLPKVLILVFVIIMINNCYSTAETNQLIIHASEMKFSRNVTIENDHVVIWGLGQDKYAWVAYPLSSLPFSTFMLNVEVAADTTVNRWPIIGIALNDTSNLITEKQIFNVNWQNIYLGQFTKSASDSIIYFLFKNDYYNRKKQQDLNLKIRTVVFQEVMTEFKTVHASEMIFSKNVTVEDDHVVIWGLGAERYAWVAYPLSSVPYSSFEIEVEASADTTDNRWPKIGLAFNDSSNLKIEREVLSVHWQKLALGEHSPAQSDSMIYFVFTNDFINRKKNQDLNLKIRNVIFREVNNDSITVNVSWNPNNEKDLAGYKIYYGESHRYYTSSIDVGMVTNKMLNLSAHKTYYAAVTAYDSALNESFYSEEVVFRFESENSASNLSKNSYNAANLYSESSIQQVGPDDFALAQNFPNPFNPTTNIHYKVPNSMRVKLRIYNMLGQKVRTLIDDELQTAGQYVVQWDGKDDFEHNVASGVYVYRIQAGKFVRTRKMLLVR